MPVLVVAENDRLHAALAAELAGAGWASRVREFTVTDAQTAGAALTAALAGDPVFVRAAAASGVLDDLVEDLSHIGPVIAPTDATVIVLDEDTWRLLHAVAAGQTVTSAARLLHLSLRTANRRIDEAKLAFGVRSRAEVLQRLAGRERVPPAPI